ncbi:pore-forming protein [Fructilactobacillus lindneri]|nr:EbsA family protein [Fructilactobacillus lindneri]ANZ58184.1 pore-forming protein [Fructilactobacillus lindneri]ANZ59505.1 pore-forming protein [Fructilactobacillus lindneri]POG98711.1 pore-forming protein [Fructilactobacillus lindneri]POH04099.1 pore-forming protein [Fructilactobacillus lindneri]POH04659.1 pore-forming protein [Fructilactobacillus lindneri]
MITQKRKFLYQPPLLTSSICWSWTLIVMLIGIIIWLEITHFQTITLGFFIAFAFLTWIQIYFRKIFVGNGKIDIHSVLNPFGKKISISSITNIKTKRNSISFDANGKNYKFLLPSNSLIELQEIISKKQ